MNENEIKNEEDEISLIDLFAVVIRYRKLIIVGTFTVTFLAGLFLFVMPKCFKKLDKTTAGVIYNVKVASIPLEIMNKLPVKNATPCRLAVYQASQFPFLAKKIKAYSIWDDNDDMNQYQFGRYVQRIVETKKIEVKSTPMETSFDIMLKIQPEKIVLAEDFVKAMVSELNVELKGYFNPMIENLEKTTSNFIATVSSSSSSSSSSSVDLSVLQNAQGLLETIKNYVDENNDFLKVGEEPFVITQAQGRMKKLVIAFFAAFFIFVFVAFLLNAIENIKADPEASKTITDAWKKGK